MGAYVLVLELAKALSECKRLQKEIKAGIK